MDVGSVCTRVSSFGVRVFLSSVAPVLGRGRQSLCTSVVPGTYSCTPLFYGRFINFVTRVGDRTLVLPRRLSLSKDRSLKIHLYTHLDYPIREVLHKLQHLFLVW